MNGMPSSAEMIRRAVTPCHVLVTDFSFGLLNFFLLYSFKLRQKLDGESKDASFIYYLKRGERGLHEQPDEIRQGASRIWGKSAEDPLGCGGFADLSLKRPLQIPVMNISRPPSFISSPPSRPSSTSLDSPLLPSYHPRPEHII